MRYIGGQIAPDKIQSQVRSLADQGMVARMIYRTVYLAALVLVRQRERRRQAEAEREPERSGRQLERERSLRGSSPQLSSNSSYLGGVSFISCFLHPPSIFPDSDKGRLMAANFLLSKALISQAICKKYLRVSSLTLAFCTISSFLSLLE